jgi:hypothetical protein
MIHYDVWSGKNEGVDNFKVFGCIAYKKKKTR